MEQPTITQPAVDFGQLFQSLPGLYLVLSPDLCVTAVTDSYLQATHSSRDRVVGQYLFDVFPESPTLKGLGLPDAIRNSLLHVVKHKQPHLIPSLRYDILNKAGKYEEHHWRLNSIPILNSTGELQQILHEVRDITAQTLHEQEAHEAQYSLRILSEAAGGTIWDCDLKQGTITWSESFRELFGAQNGQLEQETQAWTERTHPDDEERVRSLFKKAMAAKEKAFALEFRFRRLDGSYADVLSNGYIVYDAAGDPLRVIGSAVDISKHKARERQLAEANERFQRIALATNDVVWDWNLEDNMIWWNEGYKTLFGYEESEIDPTVASWLNFVHPEDLQQIESSIYAVIHNGGELWEGTYRFRCADGSYKLILDKGFVIHNSKGAATRMVGAMVDITEKQRIEQELAATMNRLQQVLESLPLLTWTATPDGLVDYYNQRWYSFTGANLDKMKDWGWQRFIHPDDLERTTAQWHHCIATGEDFMSENRWRSAQDGTYRWFLARAVPLRDADNRIRMWVGSHTDIEDHKKAEEELMEKNLELERINRDLDSFVYTASHDLKLPIVNMARIFEELVQNAAFSDPDAPKLIELFNRSLQQLHNTIHDLTEVVKVQKTKHRNLEEVNLAELTEDVKVSIQDMLQDTGAQIHTDFSGAPTLHFTRASLKSILFNLLSNAIKYRDFQRVPEVWLRSVQKGRFVELQVQDNGLGIDINKHENKLFQMFKRFHSHVQGSGLGLYIVNRLMANHGGYINIESKLNEGTTFYLYFKQKKA
ncbi:PAS domain S-box-containing protein [Pontibacter ummariensis]|uniref:histidine kinase n=1 Tax=Pontibacter ummariensis TaxID=1610492 RepID=A0A239ILQ2_9BACT|nr:PAS domain-containing protein [Pontibacter ummariensis]PRY09863.1 PAS domain S-box-containing protein [Pontibacter ummariensis]SNS93334.1 PAS domain S-box-containing protein [Pontibacter ummariensis]